MKTLIILLPFLINIIVVPGQSIPPAVKYSPPVSTHFDPEKATRLVITGIPSAERKKADDYTAGGHWLVLWNFMNAVLIVWIFLFPGSEWLKKLSFRISVGARGKSVYICLYFILSYLLTLPLNIYQHFVREKQYGFLHQPFLQWLSTDLLTIMTKSIIVVPFFLLGYAFLSRPVKNRPVYGIAILAVFIVTGIEYGLLILSGMLLVSWAFNELIRRYGERLKIANLRDMAGMPLLVFLITAYLFIMTPFLNTIKRESVMARDMHGLNTARNPGRFISSVLKSADHEKADPGYWEEFFFYDHPCLKKRIGVAEQWKAENLIFLPFFNLKGFGC